MVRIAICDDTPEALAAAARAVEGALPSPGQIRSFAAPGDLLDVVRQGWEPEIALLDIRMERMDGIGLARELTALCPGCRIIFMTDYLGYAMDVYEVRHSYFVVKSQLEQRIGSALRSAMEERPRDPRLSFRENGEIRLVSIGSVLYMERRLRKTLIYCSDGCHETSAHATDILGRAAEDGMFCQCHQSFWVNLSRVSALAEDHFRMDDGSRVPVSRSYRKAAKERLFRALHRELSQNADAAQEAGQVF